MALTLWDLSAPPTPPAQVSATAAERPDGGGLPEHVREGVSWRGLACTGDGPGARGRCRSGGAGGRRRAGRGRNPVHDPRARRRGRLVVARPVRQPAAAHDAPAVGAARGADTAF